MKLKRRLVNFRIEDDNYEFLKEYCALTKMTMTQLLNTFIEDLKVQSRSETSISIYNLKHLPTKVTSELSEKLL